MDEIKKRLEDQFGPTEHETEDLFVIAKIRSLLDGAFIKKCFVDRFVVNHKPINKTLFYKRTI